MSATLTRKGHGPEVLAKRGGSCRICPEPIEAGEHYVAKVEGLGWCHALCAKGYCETINAHLEDDADQVLAESETRRARAMTIANLVRQLRDVEVPDEALVPVEEFARRLVA